MTYYNIDKLEALLEEYKEVVKEHDGTTDRSIEIITLSANNFITFLKEKEKASSFDPNQLEIPFGDEDNGK